jgi:hypothetical protein
MIMLQGWVLAHLAGAFPDGTRLAPLPSRARYRMPWEYQKKPGKIVCNSPAFGHPVTSSEMSRIRSSNLWGWWGARDSLAKP